MASKPSTAAHAALFMRQCRARYQQPPNKAQRDTTRLVSSSHLAPSNFSKQTRRRDTEVSHPRFNSPPMRSLPPRKLQPQQALPSLGNPGQNIPPGFVSFFKYRILNLTPPPPPPHKPPPFNVLNNPWRTKKTWPPDFASMHPKQQFHFEKTFRRRMLLKTNSKRYNWNRYIRLLQQSLIIVTVVYFVFIADPYKKDGGGTPMDGFRAWFFGQVRKFEHLPGGLRDQAGELEGYYAKNWKKAPWGGDDVEDASPVSESGKMDNVKEAA